MDKLTNEEYLEEVSGLVKDIQETEAQIQDPTDGEIRLFHVNETLKDVLAALIAERELNVGLNKIIETLSKPTVTIAQMSEEIEGLKAEIETYKSSMENLVALQKKHVELLKENIALKKQGIKNVDLLARYKTALEGIIRRAKQQRHYVRCNDCEEIKFLATEALKPEGGSDDG